MLKGKNASASQSRLQRVAGKLELPAT